MRRISIVAAISCVALCAALTPTFAQQITIDDAYLTQLYSAQLRRNKPDTYIEKRIAEERSRIRKVIDADVKSSLELPTTDSANASSNLVSVVDRQQQAVTSLDEHLREAKVDFNLLEEEEEKVYVHPSTDSGSTTEFRLTKSHADLLAKKAVLEERIGAYENALPVQRDRLSKLQSQQNWEQFSAFFSTLIYVLVIAVAMMADRMVRRRIQKRVADANRRYVVSKAATAIIYGTTAAWILTKLFYEHPGAIASLAIVGAAIAVALQNVVKDFVGWITILQKGYYRLGDRISIEGYTGDVIDISPLRTTLLEVSAPIGITSPERTGQKLYMPNMLVLQSPLLNFRATSDYIETELKIRITQQSDWKRAEVILKETIEKHAGEFPEKARAQLKKRTDSAFVPHEVSDPAVHIDITDTGILFTLEFIVPIGRRRRTVSAMTREILQKFKAERDIHLAERQFL